jgi:hypothetical protein
MNVIEAVSLGFAMAGLTIIVWNVWRNLFDRKTFYFWMMNGDLLFVGSNWLDRDLVWAGFFAFFAVWNYKQWRDEDDDDDPWKWRKVKEATAKIAKPAVVPVRNYT